MFSFFRRNAFVFLLPPLHIMFLIRHVTTANFRENNMIMSLQEGIAIQPVYYDLDDPNPSMPVSNISKYIFK